MPFKPEMFGSIIPALDRYADLYHDEKGYESHLVTEVKVRLADLPVHHRPSSCGLDRRRNQSDSVGSGDNAQSRASDGDL